MNGIDIQKLVLMFANIDQTIKDITITPLEPALAKMNKKDAAQLRAFLEDVETYILVNPFERLIIGSKFVTQLFNELLSTRNIFDPTKNMRLKADEIARTYNFERYKKLRNLK